VAAEFQSIPFDPGDARAALRQLPEKSAVFALYGEAANAEPYIGRTPNLRGRLERLLLPSPKHPRRLQLAGRVRRIEWRLTGSEFESLLAQFTLLEEVYGAKALERMHLGAPSFVRFLGSNRYPRVTVTNRPSQREADWAYGPFASRAAAERFADEALKLFLLRRCIEELDPNPSHPGCVYSEMKMCLAPCFKGCTDEAYMAEVERVRSYFESGGESLLQELQAERDRLSADLDFEGAARQHEKVTKVKAIASACDEIYRRLDHIDAILVQPSAEPKSVALFRFSQGTYTGPVHFALESAEVGDEPHPIEVRLREAFEKLASAGTRSLQQFSEELGILRRWYYRSHKTGEIFFANHQGTLPIRRIANSVVRVYRGEKETSVPSPEQPTQG
jgi:excinuclease UvrABC nuclease subunit